MSNQKSPDIKRPSISNNNIANDITSAACTPSIVPTHRSSSFSLDKIPFLVNQTTLQLSPAKLRTNFASIFESDKNNSTKQFSFTKNDSSPRFNLQAKEWIIGSEKTIPVAPETSLYLQGPKLISSPYIQAEKDNLYICPKASPNNKFIKSVSSSLTSNTSTDVLKLFQFSDVTHNNIAPVPSTALAQSLLDHVDSNNVCNDFSESDSIYSDTSSVHNETFFSPITQIRGRSMSLDSHTLKKTEKTIETADCNLVRPQSFSPSFTNPVLVQKNTLAQNSIFPTNSPPMLRSSLNTSTVRSSTRKDSFSFTKTSNQLNSTLNNNSSISPILGLRKSTPDLNSRRSSNSSGSNLSIVVGLSDTHNLINSTSSSDSHKSNLRFKSLTEDEKFAEDEKIHELIMKTALRNDTLDFK